MTSRSHTRPRTTPPSIREAARLGLAGCLLLGGTAVAAAGTPILEVVPTVAESCKEEAEDCREALGKLQRDALTTIDLDITVGGRPGNDYPCECRLEGDSFQPLYFEHWNLERYGHSTGCLAADSACSAAHFFVTLPLLPYKMGVELPWECVYPVGYYRPGSCAPWTVPAPPISGRGLAVQAATMTGLAFLLPIP